MQEKQETPTTIDAYIADFPPPIRKLLEEVRAVVRKAAPQATERISYQMPTFFLEGNLVHFAAFKNHIGFYPTPTGIEEFAKDLAPYKGAKGSVQFPIDNPLPLDLIRRITEYRVAENLALAKTKAEAKVAAKAQAKAKKKATGV